MPCLWQHLRHEVGSSLAQVCSLVTSQISTTHFAPLRHLELHLPVKRVTSWTINCAIFQATSTSTLSYNFQGSHLNDVLLWVLPATDFCRSKWGPFECSVTSSIVLDSNWLSLSITFECEVPHWKGCERIILWCGLSMSSRSFYLFLV